MAATEKTGTHTWAEQEASIENAKTSAAMLTAIGMTADQVSALSGANAPSGTNVVATMADIPDVTEFPSQANMPTSDQKAALGGTSGTPSASNPYATKETADAEASARSSGDALALKIASNLSDLNNAATARTNLGLGACDNTSDSAKPVSTAQAAAIGLKASKSGDTFTGDVAISESSAMGNLLTITNTDATNYSRIKYVGTGNTFSAGVGNASATIAELRNNFYVYDFTGAKATLIGTPSGVWNLPQYTASRVLTIDANKNLSVSATTATELGYVHGVTSAIQAQLAAKAPLASPALTGVPTVPTATAGTNTTQAASTAFVAAAISTEATTRAAADTTLTTNLAAEVSRATSAEALKANTAALGSAAYTDSTAYATAAQGSTADSTASALTGHTGNTSNPHAVTKAQVGLGNCDNTADIDKPVSEAQQTVLDGKAALAGSASQNFATNTLTTTKISMGNAIDAQKILLWESGNYRFGFGIQNGELRSLFPSDACFMSFGAVSSLDGETFAEKMRITADGELRILANLTGYTANSLYVGKADSPCAGGYTNTAFTVTSAREAKAGIRDFTAAEIEVAKAIVKTCPHIYQLVTSVAEKGADAARLHSGCVYEEVRQCFVDGGLDPERYSIFCASPRKKKTSRTVEHEVVMVENGRAVVTTKDETIDEPVFEELPVVDAAGNVLLDASGKPRTYQAPVYETDETGAVKQDKGLRYEELQIWIAAGLRELAVAGA